MAMDEWCLYLVYVKREKGIFIRYFWGRRNSRHVCSYFRLLVWKRMVFKRSCQGLIVPCPTVSDPHIVESVGRPMTGSFTLQERAAYDSVVEKNTWGIQTPDFWDVGRLGCGWLSS